MKQNKIQVANARRWKHQNGGIMPVWGYNIIGGE